MDKLGNRGGASSSPRLSITKRRPSNKTEFTEAPTKASPKPSPVSSLHSNSSTPKKTQRELRKLEDYWTKNSPLTEHSPRLRKSTFDLKNVLGKRSSKNENVTPKLGHEEKVAKDVGTEGSNNVTLPESPIPAQRSAIKEIKLPGGKNLSDHTTCERKNIRAKISYNEDVNSASDADIPSEEPCKSSVQNSIKEVQFRRSKRKSQYLTESPGVQLETYNVNPVSDTKELEENTVTLDLSAAEKDIEQQSQASELDIEGHDNSNDLEDDYIPPRKKLRSEVSEDELWEGIPLTVTFKRLAPINKTKFLLTSDLEKYESSQDSEFFYSKNLGNETEETIFDIDTLKQKGVEERNVKRSQLKHTENLDDAHKQTDSNNQEKPKQYGRVLRKRSHRSLLHSKHTDRVVTESPDKHVHVINEIEAESTAECGRKSELSANKPYVENLPVEAEYLKSLQTFKEDSESNICFSSDKISPETAMSISQILECDTDLTSETITSLKSNEDETAVRNELNDNLADNPGNTDRAKSTSSENIPGEPNLQEINDNKVQEVKCSHLVQEITDDSVEHDSEQIENHDADQMTAADIIKSDTTESQASFDILSTKQITSACQSESASKKRGRTPKKQDRGDEKFPTRRSLRLTEIPVDHTDNGLSDPEKNESIDSSGLEKIAKLEEKIDKEIEKAARYFSSVKSSDTERSVKVVPPLRIKLKKVKMNSKKKVRKSFSSDAITESVEESNGSSEKNKAVKKCERAEKFDDLKIESKKKEKKRSNVCDDEDQEKKKCVKPKKADKVTKGKKGKKKTRKWSSPPSVSLRLSNERRQSAVDEMKSNPVLDKHACLIWSSENRRQESFIHPDLSQTQLDDLLRQKWMSLSDREKLRYFLRARDAVRDENRHSTKRHAASLKDETPCKGAVSPDQSSMVRFLAMDSRAQISELKTWLHFYHEVSPEQYGNVMSDFKASLSKEKELEKKNLENARHKQKVKKSKKKLKDMEVKTDSHANYRKLLFEKLYEYREKVIGIWSEKKDMQNQIFLETFNSTVRRLVAGETIPLSADVKSERLTEVLTDIRTLEREKKVSVTGVLPDNVACREVVKRLNSQLCLRDSQVKTHDSSTDHGQLSSQDVLTALDLSHNEEQLDDHIKQISDKCHLPTLSPDGLDSFFTQCSNYTSQHQASQSKLGREIVRPSSPGSILTDWVAEDLLNAQPIGSGHREISQTPRCTLQSSGFVIPRLSGPVGSSASLSSQQNMLSLINKNQSCVIGNEVVPYRSIKSAYTHSRVKNHRQRRVFVYDKVINPLKGSRCSEGSVPSMLPVHGNVFSTSDRFHLRQSLPRPRFNISRNILEETAEVPCRGERPQQCCNSDGEKLQIAKPATATNTTVTSVDQKSSQMIDLQQ